MQPLEQHRILVVEPDPPLAQVLTDLLEAEFHHTARAGDAASGLRAASTEPFDLILMDQALPDRSGLALCQELRHQGIETPLMMLSGRTTLADRVQGLMVGADDYLTKPFHPAELIARVHALLRRARKLWPGGGARRAVGDLTLDFAAGRVEKDGRKVNLATKEFELLKYLAERPDRVVGRDELLRNVWGYHTSTTRTLDVHVAQLRQKLEPNPAAPALLLTIRGQGYQFCSQPRNAG